MQFSLKNNMLYTGLGCRKTEYISRVADGNLQCWPAEWPMKCAPDPPETLISHPEMDL